MPLGEASDAAIARAWGVSPQAVLWQRRQRGIPAYAGRADSRNLRIPWHTMPLGALEDTEIARALQVHPVTVLRVRQHRDIGTAPISAPRPADQHARCELQRATHDWATQRNDARTTPLAVVDRDTVVAAQQDALRQGDVPLARRLTELLRLSNPNEEDLNAPD